jgi:hypothetical protein
VIKDGVVLISYEIFSHLAHISILLSIGIEKLMVREQKDTTFVSKKDSQSDPEPIEEGSAA